MAEKEPKIESEEELDVPATGDETTAASTDDETSVEHAENVQEGQPKLPVIGDYALLGRIGAGGMGRVFKLKQPK